MADENQQPDDGLTPDERKFMETRGESGLPETPETPAEPPAPETPPATQAEGGGDAQHPPADVAAADDDGDDEATPETVDPKTGKQHPRRVNYNKYKTLEAKFQESERTRTQLAETVARFDERLKVFSEALTEPATDEQQQAAEADPMPNPQEDIFAYLQWQQRETTRITERLSQQIAGVQEHVQTRANNDQFMMNYRGDMMRYAQIQPKVPEAYEYLIARRHAQLQAMGVNDINERNRIAQGEERGLVMQAYKDGVNPAERLYALSLQYGYNPQAAAVAPQPAAGAANGAAPTNGAKPTHPAAVTPAPIARPNVGAEIDAVRNGQNAAMSLSQGGGVPTAALTAEVIANMDSEAFSRFMETTPKSKIRELLGGG